MKTLVVVASLAALLGAGASALAGTYQAFGHTFTYDDFQPQSFETTVATEKATGHKMRLVRLKNGHVMAMVPGRSLHGAHDDRPRGYGAVVARLSTAAA